MFDFDFDYGETLQFLGLENAPEDVKVQIIKGLHERLEDLVRVRLFNQMNEEDLAALEKAAEKSDEEGKRWLEQRFPDHKQIYQEEFDSLLATVKMHGDTVVAVTEQLRQNKKAE